MIKGVLCSTGALITRRNGRDPRLLPGFASAINCSGFELMLYPSWYEDGKLGGYIDFLCDSGLNFPVLHADKSIGELLSMGGDDNVKEAWRRFTINCRAAELVGSDLMVLHLWGGPASDYEIERNIGELPSFMDYAGERGLQLAVENVICAKQSPLEIIKTIIAKVPGAVFTIDTKMAEFHSELAETSAYAPLFEGGRAVHLHVNDYGGGYKDFNDLRVLHLGYGHVDFESFFKKLNAVGYHGYATVEATSVLEDGSIDFEKLNNSLNIVKSRLADD